MTGQYFRNSKPIVGGSIVTFVLPTLFSKLGGPAAQACNLLGKMAWVALAVLRSVILLADWPALSACLWEDSRRVQNLLKIVASIWPLLCSMAGREW